MMLKLSRYLSPVLVLVLLGWPALPAGTQASAASKAPAKIAPFKRTPSSKALKWG